jgi:hypothetical protein
MQRCFRKIAVVSEDGFFQKVYEGQGFIDGCRSGIFPHKERIAAMNWIAE